MKNKHPNRNTRQDKTGRGKVKPPKRRATEGGENLPNKHKQAAYDKLPPISGKSQKQKDYIALLRDPHINAIIVRGLFGTGKTYCAATIAADALISGEIEKIIVARPYVQTGKTSGFKPGTTLEKLYPYVRNILDSIKVRMGPGPYYEALKDGLTGKIEVQDLESIRGRSFDQPSFLIVDEAQQADVDVMKAIVTRVSDECKLVLCGDESQRDTRGVSGLTWFSDFSKRHQLSTVASVNFNSVEDIVRGGLCREIAIGLAKDDN